MKEFLGRNNKISKSILHLLRQLIQDFSTLQKVSKYKLSLNNTTNEK